MRCFLAVDIPFPKELEEIYYGLKGQKTVPKTNFHSTIHFFGEITDEKALNIKNSLGHFEFNRFEASLRGIGFFPNRESPRVIWAGISGNEFRELHSECARVIGFAEDPEFMPHATLSRVKGKIDPKLIEQLNGLKEQEFSRFMVERIVLKKSVLGEHGASHEEIAGKRLL